MNITEHLKKDYWLRRVTPDTMKHIGANGGNYKDSRMEKPGAAYIRLTQDDFLNEIQPSAHQINTDYFSKRPVYKPSGKKDPKTGKEEWVLDHYDDIQSVALGLQLWISLKKTTHFAGNGFWIANETTNNELFEKLMSWKDTIGLNTAFLEVVDSCNQTGDAALYLYQTDEGIDYEVFSYLKGDVLYPGFDENFEKALYRQYRLNGRDAVDIFTAKYRQTWVKVDETDEQSFLQRLKRIVKIQKGERTEDGYIKIAESVSQTADVLQAVYFRVDDIPSGPAENAIETLEESISYMAEEVKNDAFPILFLKSRNIANLPPSSMNGKTIGVRGDANDLQHADAKFLVPPDMSNIATANVTALTDNILRTTSTVEISPDILKSGADSSTTIKILYTPEIQWCMRQWIFYFKPVKQVVEVFKRLVGKAEGQISEFANLKVSVGQNVYIPQNEKETSQMIIDRVYARVCSRKAAMADLESPHLGDYEQITKEWKDELDMKARVPAIATAEVNKEFGLDTNGELVVDDESNPQAPKIDKNDKGRTIAER